MANVELPKVADRRLKAEDFRSEAFRRDAVEREVAEAEITAGRGVDLEALETQLQRRPIDQIAALMRWLTYGEMIELAEELLKFKPQGSEISKDNLPGLLHRWSTAGAARLDDARSAAVGNASERLA
jgi:hypothetical protein